jgi:two-component system sensor histidine kinase KdpD
VEAKPRHPRRDARARRRSDRIGRGEAEASERAPGDEDSQADAEDPRRGAKRLRFAWALAACAFTTIVATILLPYFDLANIVMLFLLTVVLVALKLGRGPAVLAAFVSVAAFDFFCVPRGCRSR